MASIYNEGFTPKIACRVNRTEGTTVARRKLVSKRKLKLRIRHAWTPHILFHCSSHMVAPSCSPNLLHLYNLSRSCTRRNGIRNQMHLTL